MLKYYLDDEEITSREYEDFLCDDAYCWGETKTTAMRVIRENRQEARTEGESAWTLRHGSVLLIRKE